MPSISNRLRQYSIICLVLWFLALAITGCGQQGALYLPQPAPTQTDDEAQPKKQGS